MNAGFSNEGNGAWKSDKYHILTPNVILGTLWTQSGLYCEAGSALASGEIVEG